MADIFETCELINQYIEESKGNALDKMFVSDKARIKKLDEAIESTPEGKIRDLLFKKRQNAFDDLKEKLGKVVKGADITDVDNFVHNTDNYRGIQGPSRGYLKKAIGTGKGNIPKDKEPGQYLRAQKAIHESTDARLNIYEAYESGVITEFEKDELLNILNTYE